MSPLATEMSKLVDLSRAAVTAEEASAFRRQALELFYQANPAKRPLPKAVAITLYEDEVELWNKTYKQK